MSSKIQDLVTKIREFTGIPTKRLLLWRVTSRGGRSSNKFEMVSDNTQAQSQKLFRPKKESEVIYVRVRDEESEP